MFRMKFSQGLLAAAAVATLVVAPHAQQVQIITGPEGPMQMGGPPGRQFKTGTGRIRGRVVSAETGTPIRRAQVRISGTNVAPKAAMTDAEGRYEFTDLPDGSFSLTATKSGYMNVQYGQTRPYESGRTIELADKQVLDKADIVMPRGGVISGRIVDEFGDPLPDVTVTAMRQSWQGGRRRLVPAGRFGQTNDLGQYRMYGLPPGEYYVSATLRSEMAMFEMMGPNGPVPGASAPTSGYAPTYFPGTPTAAEAQRVTVGIGQESQSTDFALLPVRLVKITGIVLNSEGRPVEGAMVTAVPSRGLEGLPMMGASNTRTGKDGAFTLPNVTPGDYTLQVRQVQVMTSSAGGDSMMFTTRVGGPGGDQEFGMQPVSVSGEDLSNVVITTSKGGIATGRVTFDGTRPTNTNAVRVQAMPVEMDGPMFGGGMGSAIKADGTFEIKGMAGLRLIRVMGIPQGWSLKSVIVNGMDVTDTGIDFKAGESASGIDVVLTSKTTQVSGAVTQSDGTPVKDYTVVVFSEDSQKWTTPMTRWVTGTRPDQDGRFKVRNLPPGSYYAIAVEYIPQGEWGDPDLLERLRSRATHFTVDEGGTETLDLKIVDSY